MKKTVSVILTLTMLLMASAAWAKPSKEEVGALIQERYTGYMQDKEVMAYYGDEQNDPRVDFAYVVEPLNALLTTVEQVMWEEQRLPGNSKAIREKFLDVYRYAHSLSQDNPDAGIMDMDRYEKDYNGQLSLGVLGSEWYFRGTVEGAEVFAGPVMLVDADKQIIDSPYLLCVFAHEGLTRTWLCTDARTVHETLMALEANTIKGRNKEAKEVVTWLEEKQGYFEALDKDVFILDEGVDTDYLVGAIVPREWPGTALPTEGPVAPGMIGTVLVTNDSAVNLRAEDNPESELVGKAKTGDVFACLSVSEETGWYEIAYEGGTAYVSGRMVTFTPLEY